MLNFLTIGTNVLSGGRDRLALFRENARFVHVVPGVIDLSRAHKLLIVVEASPVILRILVKEVNPDGISRPASTLEVLITGLILHKDAIHIRCH